MDKYTEDAEAELEYMHKEMMLTKSNVLLKIKYQLKEEDFLDKLAKLIVYANAEDITQAQEIIEYLEIDDLDKLSVLEDLDGFSHEFKELKENTYIRDNYEQ